MCDRMSLLAAWAALMILVAEAKVVTGQIRPSERYLTEFKTISAIALSGDRKVLAVSGGVPNTKVEMSRGSVSIWDTSTMKSIYDLDGSHTLITAIAFDSDNKFIATGTIDGSVVMWDLTRRKQLSVLKGHKEPIRTVFFLDGARSLCTVSTESLRIWDQKSEKARVLNAPDDDYLMVASPIPNSDRMVIGLRSGKMQIVNVLDLKISDSMLEREHRRVVGCIAVSRGASAFVSADGEGKVVLWNGKDLSRQWAVTNGLDDIRSLCFNPNGELIVSGSFRSNVDVWHTTTGKHLLLLDGHRSPVTGTVFLSASDLITSDASGDLLRWKLP